MVREIESLQNPLIKHLTKLRQNRDYRHEHHSAVIEGVKMIREIGKVKTLLTYDETLVPEGVKADEIITVNESVIKKITGLETSDGLLAEVAMPAPSSLKSFKRIMALDSVNDPGNLGTLIRTALAFGWEGVFLLENCCDPFNEKAIRAAKGATFRLPYAYGTAKELFNLNLPVFAADIKGQAPSPIDKGILVLGNEAQGLSEAFASADKVSLPMSGPMESLNVSVAGGILLYLMKGGQ